MGDIVTKDKTSYMALVFLQQTSDGQGATGFVASTLTCYYYRPGAAAAINIPLSDLTALDDAYTPRGILEINATYMPGMYLFHVPDAVLASGVDTTSFFFSGTGLVHGPAKVQLFTVNPQDGNLGLTGLSGLTAPDTSGGLATTGSLWAGWTTAEQEQIRSAVGVDGDKTSATGGQLQALAAIADAIKAITDNIPDSGEMTSIAQEATVSVLPSASAIATAVWAAVINGTKTAGTALLDIWRRIVGNTHDTNKTAGTQQFYNPDGATGDGVSIDEDGNRTTT